MFATLVLFPDASLVVNPSVVSNFNSPNFVAPFLNSIVSPFVIIWANEPVEAELPLIFPDSVILPPSSVMSDPLDVILPYTVKSFPSTLVPVVALELITPVVSIAPFTYNSLPSNVNFASPST